MFTDNQAEARAGECPDNPMPITVLFVDDLAEIRFVARVYLESFGFLVQLACSAEEALARFDANLSDVVVTDNSMPGMTGEEMAHIIKMRSPSTPVIMYSGLQPKDSSALDAVVLKPTALSELKAVIQNVLSRKHPKPKPESGALSGCGN